VAEWRRAPLAPDHTDGHTRYGDPQTHHNVFVAVIERAAGANLTWLFPSFRIGEPTVWLTTAAYVVGVTCVTRAVLKGRSEESPLIQLRSDAQRAAPASG
jgi:hypothetical protein